MGRIRLENIDLNIIAKMSRTMRHLDRMVSKSILEFSITKPQLDVLFVLRFSLERFNATDIAQELFVSKANVSGLIARLEKDGLVKRAADSTDSRVKKLVLTDKANAILDKIFPEYFEMTSEIMSKFSDKEKSKLLNQLDYIESCMGQRGDRDAQK